MWLKNNLCFAVLIYRFVFSILIKRHIDQEVNHEKRQRKKIDQTLITKTNFMKHYLIYFSLGMYSIVTQAQQQVVAISGLILGN